MVDLCHWRLHPALQLHESIGWVHQKKFTYVDEDGVGSDPTQANKQRTKSSNFDAVSLLSSTSIDQEDHFDEEARDFDFLSGTEGGRVRKKSSPPLLSLDSSENVNSFFMARRILKSVGEVYHFRMQLLAFCILLAFFFAMFVIFYTKVFLRYNLSLVLTTTAAMLFVFGTGGVLEMVHQGGLANYQISRCLTYVDEQSISFFDNFQEIHTGKKNRQRLLYVHVGMRYDLNGNGIRCEFFSFQRATLCTG